MIHQMRQQQPEAIVSPDKNDQRHERSTANKPRPRAVRVSLPLSAAERKNGTRRATFGSRDGLLHSHLTEWCDSHSKARSHGLRPSSTLFYVLYFIRFHPRQSSGYLGRRNCAIIGPCYLQNQLHFERQFKPLLGEQERLIQRIIAQWTVRSIGQCRCTPSLRLDHLRDGFRHFVGGCPNPNANWHRNRKRSSRGSVTIKRRTVSGSARVGRIEYFWWGRGGRWGETGEGEGRSMRAASPLAGGGSCDWTWPSQF